MTFWRELPNALIRVPAGAYTVSAGGAMMELPNGAYILGQRDLSSRMYLRPHAERLYEVIRATLESAGKKGVLVVGTPGIGTRQTHSIHTAPRLKYM